MNPDQLLIKEPKWKAEDLGSPLPASIHANSVCLPHLQDVIDYEEKNPRVIKRLQAGYPRFVIPPSCARLFDLCRAKFGQTGELCLAYPTETIARRAADYTARWSERPVRVVPWGQGRVHIVFFPADAETAALKYWRHTGEGISSRQAEALLKGQKESFPVEARTRLVQRIAGHAGVPADCVYLFKSGMAAIYAMYRAVMRLRPEGVGVQFGFPYVDTLKILEGFGHRSAFFPLGNANDLKMLQRMVMIDELSAIFTEFPSNPLLNSPDLHALSQLCRRCRIPLIVDDTISSWYNTDVLKVADASVASLTKYVAGRGDLMSGVAILNPQAPSYAVLRGALREEYEDCNWGENIALLDQYATDFTERMERVNRTTAEVCAWLHQHPLVKTVYYPAYQTRELYDALRKPGGGYSGLFSILLHEAATRTAPFYNHLAFNKGPNLGTTFSLCCPYTLLAHYDELDWARQCGVSRHLLRFSIGLEEPADLIARLEKAFAAIA